MSQYGTNAGPRTEANSGGGGPAPATDRAADLAIDMAAEVIRLRHLIDRILMFSDYTATQQSAVRREAGIFDG